MKDITQNKHGGNANSTAAFGAIKDELKPRQQLVYNTIIMREQSTVKDIAFWLGCGMNAISGRLTELKKMGKIKVTGRRDGCAIYQINEP
jgi:predicted transcriptional regulator